MESPTSPQLSSAPRVDQPPRSNRCSSSSARNAYAAGEWSLGAEPLEESAASRSAPQEQVARDNKKPNKKCLTVSNRFAALHDEDVGLGEGDDCEDDGSTRAGGQESIAVEQPPASAQPKRQIPKRSKAKCTPKKGSHQVAAQSSQVVDDDIVMTAGQGHACDAAKVNCSSSEETPQEAEKLREDVRGATSGPSQDAEMVAQLLAQLAPVARPVFGPEKDPSNYCAPAPCDIAERLPSPPSTSGTVERSPQAPKPTLTDAQADVLAMIAIRGNESLIASHIRSAALKKIMVAAPFDVCTTGGSDILQVEAGHVVLCEATDAAGWGFGTIIAPARLSGQRGCFLCEEFRPVMVELRQQRTSDSLDLARGTWRTVEISGRAGTTQDRLREKAILKRIKAARAAYKAARAAS